MARLDVAVPDDDGLRSWLGGPPPLGVALHPGSPGGPLAVALATPRGPLPVEVR